MGKAAKKYPRPKNPSKIWVIASKKFERLTPEYRGVGQVEALDPPAPNLIPSEEIERLATGTLMKTIANTV